jgi:mannan endo-1,4-beta-mannosidase
MTIPTMTSRFRLSVDLHIVVLLLGGLACGTDDSQPGLHGSVPGFVELDEDAPTGAAPTVGVSEPADTSRPPGGSSSGYTSGSDPGVEAGSNVSGPVASGGSEMGGGSAGANTDLQDGGAPGVGEGAAPMARGFFVDGRTLRDRCGDPVVLRGVNEMVIYTQSQDGLPAFSEMARSGANSVRITWNTRGPVEKLDAAMGNSIANQMIPMVVLNDATGDLSRLGQEVDYWVRSDVLATIVKYEDKALVNIANEAGNGSVTRAAFTSAYQNAIQRMRSAGIHTPLVIDGSQWGQDIDILQAVGPGLITFDPDHNLIFSVHTYWNDPNGARVTAEIDESVSMGLPLIVGEFAQHAVAGCGSAPFAYKTLLSLAQRSQIGFFPWSWGAVRNGDCRDDQPFDMTTDGTFAGLQGWGAEVAVTDPNSIQKTSVRSRYMLTSSCL